MIYLIGEIILYLLSALLLGAVAGWLLYDWRVGQRLAANPDAFAAPGLFTAGTLFAESRAVDLEAELLETRAWAGELETQTKARAAEIESLTRRLTGAERRMLELERERELQNRALQVLHQQLELAIERRVPPIGRATGTAG